MNLSLNEVEATARKAARGAGYDWGLAEETGRAARWLCRQGIDGCTVLTAWLSRIDGHDLATFRPQSLAGSWRAHGELLCPIAAGAAFSDCAGLLPGGKLRARAVGAQLLLLPFAAAAARRLECPIRLEAVDLQAVLSSGGDLVLDRDWRDLVAAAPMDISLTLGGTGKTGPGEGARARTPEDRWQELNRFAARTYAPASEESRRLGAGSDMVDSE